MMKKIVLSLLLIMSTPKIILCEGDTFNSSDCTLIDAIYDRDYKKIEELVVQGADINLQDSREWTPLRHAVNSENIRTVKFLVEQGSATPANCGESLIYAYDAFLQYAFDGLECYAMKKDNVSLQDVLPLAMLEKDFDYDGLEIQLLKDEHAWREICGYKDGMNVFLEHRNAMFDIIICLIKAGADITLAHQNIKPFHLNLQDDHPCYQNDDYVCTILDSVLDMEAIFTAHIQIAESKREEFAAQRQEDFRSADEYLAAAYDLLDLIIKIKLELQ